MPVLLLFMGWGTAMAQTGTVAGTVTDVQTGETLPGAAVQLSEIDRGTATNVDGEYVLEDIDPGDYTLTVSFVGFRSSTTTVTVTAGETTNQDIALRPDELGLEELVVTGQGSGIQSRRLSTTTESISAEDLEEFSVGRIDQALQSQLSGTQIRLNSGQPGTTSLIRSRGPVSAGGATTPVIYVDGVRVDNNSTGSPLDIGTGGARSSSIADISFDEIERIEFLKGGAATTLYGSDAANGVLQIFTKSGTADRRSFNFETTLGAETGTKDFLRFDRAGDVFFDTGLIQTYQLTGSGAVGEEVTYNFSGKMYDNDAARVGNKNIRYDLRTKVGAQLTDWARYEGSATFVNNRFTRDFNANTSFSAFGNVEGGQLFQSPDGPVTIDDLSDQQFRTVRDSLRRNVALYDNLTEVRRWQTSQQLRFDPLESVSLTLKGGLDYRFENNTSRITNELLTALGSGGQSSFDNFSREFLGLTMDANIRHQADWRFLSFITNVGGQVFRDEISITLVNADDLPDGTNTAGAASETTGNDNFTQVSQQGFYLKENIGFFDRFFLDFGIRGDNNSAFGDEIGIEWYPSIGASYTLSDEPFFEANVPRSIMSNAKIRANYGEAGNFPPAFAGDRLLNVNAFLGQTSFSFAAPGDPNLGPERVGTWEIGGDFRMLNARVGLSVTRYNATTTDALFTAPFAPSTAQANQVRNIGEIENKGWEFATDLFILDEQDYSLTLNASLNTLSNEVTDNGGTAKFNNGGFTFLGTFVDEGKPIGYLEGDNPTFDPETGEVTEIERRAVIGDPNPDQFGSMSMRARYKSLSLFVSADYQLGAQGINTDDVLRFFSGVADEGRFPNPNNDEVPPALAQGFSFFDLASVWVEDTDYLKVRNISLGYRVPEGLLPGQLSSLRLRAGVTNPFNFVKSRFDPEITGSDNAAGTVSGVFGFGTVSPPRQWTFSVNMGF